MYIKKKFYYWGHCFSSFPQKEKKVGVHAACTF